jgi:hypothetical protein
MGALVYVNRHCTALGGVFVNPSVECFVPSSVYLCSLSFTNIQMPIYIKSNLGRVTLFRLPQQRERERETGTFQKSCVSEVKVTGGGRSELAHLICSLPHIADVREIENEAQREWSPWKRSGGGCKVRLWNAT